MSTYHSASTTGLLVGLALSVSGLTACSKSENPCRRYCGHRYPAPAPAAPAAPAINDAQIAHIAVTANAIDSAAGVVAKKKATAKSVKDFAQTMISDHMGVNKQAVALATKLGVTPEDNDVSRQLKSGADESAATLSGLTGAAFDKAYIDREVAYHQGGRRRARQDADPERAECGPQGPAREGSAGIRCAPRAREGHSGVAFEVVRWHNLGTVSAAVLVGRSWPARAPPRERTRLHAERGVRSAKHHRSGRGYCGVDERGFSAAHRDRA
jgi:predicted outer membrane protein